MRLLIYYLDNTDHAVYLYEKHGLILRIRGISSPGDFREDILNKYFSCGYICNGSMVADMATRTGSATPLSAAVFSVLLSLAEGEKHGYQIMKDARTREGGN